MCRATTAGTNGIRPRIAHVRFIAVSISPIAASQGPPARALVTGEIVSATQVPLGSRNGIVRAIMNAETARPMIGGKTARVFARST